MTEEIIIEQCFNCQKKKDIADNWRNCKLKCSYKYKKRENDEITRLKQENEKLKKERDIVLGQLVINDGEDVTVQISQSQFEQYNNYRKALEEIREMINEVCWDYTDITILSIKDKILNKSNEVLG